MKQSVFIAAALASAAGAQSVGSAVVVNSCNYEVYLANVPSADGGYEEIDAVLTSNGGTYGQTFTQLSNGNGWSLKLSQSQRLDNIMQYEYTFHNDGTIWFDLSDVNGNPWDGNWEVTSKTSSCTPKQAAYRFSTDDAYGMQACPQDSIITVELCSGDKGAGASSAIVPVEPTTTIVPVSTFSSSAIPTPSVPATTLVTAIADANSPTMGSPTVPAPSVPATTFATAVAEASSATAPPATYVTVTALSEADFAPAPSPIAQQWRHTSKHQARELLHQHRYRRHGHAHM